MDFAVYQRLCAPKASLWDFVMNLVRRKRRLLFFQLLVFVIFFGAIAEYPAHLFTCVGTL